MAVFTTVLLDLAKGEQALEIGVPASKGTGHFKFGDIHGSFSVGAFPKSQEIRRVGLLVVKHTHTGAGAGVPEEDPNGITWIPVASGRHGEFYIEPGEESVEVALADLAGNPDFCTVALTWQST